MFREQSGGGGGGVPALECMCVRVCCAAEQRRNRDAQKQLVYVAFTSNSRSNYLLLRHI